MIRFLSEARLGAKNKSLENLKIEKWEDLGLKGRTGYWVQMSQMKNGGGTGTVQA